MFDEKLVNRIAGELKKNNQTIAVAESVTAGLLQAALASAGTFAVGAVLPLLMVLLLPVSALMWGIAGGSLFFLAVLGFLAARAGGHP